MKRAFLQTLFLAALLLPPLVSAQVTFIYDQQSSDESHTGINGIRIQEAQPTGQSFRPTLNQVSFIRLNLSDGGKSNDLGATLSINLRSNSFTGPIIASTSPVTLPDNFGVTGGGFVNFFFSSPVTVRPEATYFFQPVVESGDSWWADVALFSYDRGTSIGFGQNDFPLDYWFREGVVVVPEPSAGVLVILGTATLCQLSRRSLFVRRRHRSLA